MQDILNFSTHDTSHSEDSDSESHEIEALRRLAERAARQFGFTSLSLKLLQHLVNTTFQLAANESRFLLRVHREGRSVIEVTSELMWLEALRQRGIEVQKPQRTPNGDLALRLSSPDVPNLRTISILHWLDGEVLPQTKRTSHHFFAIGQLLARMHNHAEHWTLPSDFSRPTYDANGLLGTPDDEDWALLPQHMRHNFSEVHQHLTEMQAEFGQDRQCFGLIHSDLSFGNVLYDENEARPIDFDDCGFGYFAYDIAVPLAGRWGHDDYHHSTASLLDGYRSIRSFSSEQEVLLPLFMAARATSLALWAARQPDESTRNWVEGQWQRVKELKAYI